MTSRTVKASRSRHADGSKLGEESKPSRGAHDITFDTDFMPESSLWHDAPLFVAILPCLGAFFFGADYIQDIILFLCVCWYLHTCIRLPWSLYELSRPRGISKNARLNMTPTQIAAEEALQWRSLALLALAFCTPFAGLILLRKVLHAVGAVDNGPYITYFHSTLFVLFSGVRPLNHAAALIAGRTRVLQGRVHHPPTEHDHLQVKIDQMELQITTMSEKLRDVESAKFEDHSQRHQGLLTIQDSFERTAARLEDGAKRRELKAELTIEMMERKIEGLEKQCEVLLTSTRGLRRQDDLTLSAFLIKWLDQLELFWKSLKRSPVDGSSPNSFRVDLKKGRATTNGSRRRSYDAANVNLQTVVEEGEVEDNVVVASDGAVTGRAIAKGVRRRSRSEPNKGTRDDERLFEKLLGILFAPLRWARALLSTLVGRITRV